jgi:nicotinate dehydrogenase subunit B
MNSNARGISRREFLTTMGGMVVSFAVPASASTTWPVKIAADALDSWLLIGADGHITASVGKIDAGMGIVTSFTQIVAEELDVSMDAVTIHMGDTATTPDQRGTGSSNGIIDGGSALRNAAAEARAALLAMAAERLNVPVAQLMTANGAVNVIGAPEKRASYTELIGGKRFDMKISGKVKPKDASQYRLVGKAIPRKDIDLKVAGTYDYMVDFKLPDMLHARVIRPPQAGAKFLSFDTTQKLAGLVKVVTRGDFVAVVCQREEQAIKAARELKTKWSTPPPMFSKSYDALYQHLRETKPVASEENQKVGDVAAAFEAAATKLDVYYEYPFQSHACMGPACAVADVAHDRANVWMGGQKPYPLRKAVAEMAGFKLEQVRVTWLPGPGSYGMNDADDAALDAAFISKEIGKPVRLQYSRADATAWDPKGPPSTIHMRGGIDEKSEAVLYHFESHGYSGRVRPSGTDSFGDSLAAQLIGGYKANSTNLFQLPSESYKFANKRRAANLLDWTHSLNTGLRTAHLRDPDGMATCFASECFIDELAHATKMDAVEFRLKHLPDERHRAVVKAAAEKAGWQTRLSPRARDTGPLVTGRGIAYAPRAGTIVAIVADVEINIESGKLRVTRFVAAHDCGFVVNPLSLVGTIEANLMQAMSRAMFEAVQFDEHKVMSVDWASYPIADITDTPDQIDVVIVNNAPGIKSTGAGEPATRPVAAAIGNAIFDATGVRIRRVPFTAAALKVAFKAARQI